MKTQIIQQGSMPPARHLFSAESRFGRRTMAVILAGVSMALVPVRTHAAVVIAPDNGAGTATMPPVIGAYAGNPMAIIDGLPAGTTISIPAPVFGSFNNVVEAPGGTLLGSVSQYGAVLQLPMIGTGGLAGFNRFIPLPLLLGSNEFHSAPRTAFAPVQTYLTDLVRMQAQITGDPDFDLLRITAGTMFGLPSPGQTTLTTTGGGQWNVDSFFDITYRIDFVGAPGGSLAGRSGSTTGTARFQMGEAIPEPSPLLLGAIGFAAIAGLRRTRSRAA